MGKCADELVAMIELADPFAVPQDKVRELQLGALNERLEECTRQIPSLGHRRSEIDLDKATALGDVVPLLFAYRNYRSYPESLIEKGRWEMLARWMESLSAVPGKPDMKGCTDIDDWLERMRAAGHFVQVNSGADGKVALLDQTERDFSRMSLVPSIAWATGIQPEHDRCAVLLIPRYGHNVYIGAFTKIGEAYGKPGDIHFLSEEPSPVEDIIRTGTISRAILLGTAAPAEASRLEADAKMRQQAMDARFHELAKLLLERKGEKVVIFGLSNQHLALVDALDALGAPDGLFHPDSLIGPGIRVASRMSQETIDRIFRKYGTDQARSVRSYAMSEVLSQMPMCEAGRYHVPPWQAVIMVDGDGEKPLSAEGQVEGRVAIFDFLVEGRWGGFLTRDKATLDHGDCACGRPGPTVLDSIGPYPNLDDDKLSCAGSIDSYIRGVIEQ